MDLSLLDLEFALWTQLDCRCRECERLLESIEQNFEPDPIEWAKKNAPIAFAAGWRAIDEFELICRDCRESIES